jgi:hypothetical protein
MTSSTSINWATDLPALAWFVIGEHLVLENDDKNALSNIARLAATCRTLYNLLWSSSSTSFWCHSLLHTKCLSRSVIHLIVNLLRHSGDHSDSPSIHRRLFAKRRKRQARSYRASFIEFQQDVYYLSGRWYRSSFVYWLAPSRQDIRGYIAVERVRQNTQFLLQRRCLSVGLLQLYYDR